MRYAGGNVHDGDGALHPFLRGGRRKPPYFLSVSMMADKESSKETFVQSAINKSVKIYLYMATFLYLCKIIPFII